MMGSKGMFEKLRDISRFYNVAIMTAQQPQCKFSYYQKEMSLSPHKGESSNIDVFIIDYINLIK